MATYFEKQQTTIGDFTYEVTALPGRTGSLMLLKMAKGLAPLFIGPAIMAALQGGGRAALAGIDVSKLTDSIQNLSESDFNWICTQFAATTCLVSGNDRPALGANNGAAFDLHFSRRYQDLFAWLEFCVEVNFGPFLLELKAKVIAAKAAAERRGGAAASPSTSPAT